MASLKKSYFKHVSIDIMPGFRVVPESPLYSVDEARAYGTVALATSPSGDLVYVNFVVISNWTPAQMTLLHKGDLTQCISWQLSRDLVQEPGLALYQIRTSKRFEDLFSTTEPLGNDDAVFKLPEM